MNHEDSIVDAVLLIPDSVPVAVKNGTEVTVFESLGYVPGDSINSVLEKDLVCLTGFEGTPIPYRLRADDGITAILLLCFFLIAHVLSHGKKFLIQEAKDFVHTKERNNLFANSTAADFRYRLLLLFQTCVLLGIYFFDYFLERTPDLLKEHSSFVILCIYIGICTLFYVVKWLTYRYLIWIFFDKTKGDVWLEAYSTILYYFGFTLFPLVLLLVYFDLSANILVPIFITLLIFTKILMFFKWIKLFFNNIYGLLLIILYFCALEIMPCLLLYQALIQINNILLIKI